MDFFCIFVLFFYFIFGPSSIYGFCYLQAVFIDAIYDADEKGIFINKMDSIVPVKCMVALFFDCLVKGLYDSLLRYCFILFDLSIPYKVNI